MNNILVLCFLGDPTLEPASVEGTGGFNVDSKELVQILSETKYNVTLITNYSFADQPSTEELAANIRLYRIRFRTGSLQNQNLLKEQVDEIIKEVIKVCPSLESIFVIHSLYWFSGYISYKISHTYHIPFIYTPVSLGYNKIKNGVALKCTCQEEWENIFLPKAALVLAITYSEEKILSEHYKVSQSRIVVVGRIISLSRNIVSKEQYDKFEENNYKKKLEFFTQAWYIKAFTFIGRIVPDKGIMQIIYAWYQLYLEYNNIPSLWIIGGSKEEINALYNKLKTEFSDFDELKRSMRICFWGYLPPEIINVLLLRTLVLLEHSRYEEGGRVLLEAFSTGTPVIATPYGFAKDLVKDWINGFLVEYNNINQLKEKMRFFIRHPMLSDVLGNAAFDIYRYYKSNWNCAEKHLEIYKAFHEKNTSLYKPIFSPESYQNVEINYFSKGLVNQYKDYSHNIYDFCLEINLPLETFKEISNATGKSLLWENETCYIKQLYTTFNYAPLWNIKCDQFLINQKEKMDRTILVSQMPMVINLLSSDIVLSMYCTSRYNKVIIDKNNFTVAGELIKQFNYYMIDNKKTFDIDFSIWKNDEFSQNNKNTLASFWQELLSATELKKYNSRLWEIATLFYEDSLNIQEVYGLNYGKRIIEHIVFDKNKYYLLPSASAYWGQIGYDAGYLIYDQIQYEKSIENIEQYILELADLYNIGPHILINWVVFIFIKILIRNETIQLHKDTMNPYEIIEFLFDLYQSKSF